MLSTKPAEKCRWVVAQYRALLPAGQDAVDKALAALPRRPVSAEPVEEDDAVELHPGWSILDEEQGLTLERIKVLVTLLANDHVEPEDVMTIADCILDAVAAANAQRNAALDTLKIRAAS